MGQRIYGWIITGAALVCLAILGIGFQKETAGIPQQYADRITDWGNGEFLFCNDPGNIAVDTQEKQLFYDNMLIVYTDGGLSAGQQEELARMVDGTVVGKLDKGLSVLQILVEPTGLAQLHRMAQQLAASDLVLAAEIDVPLFEEPGGEGDSNPDEAQKDAPEGGWWEEAIGADTAWEYEDFCQSVPVVGVVDNGFKLDHECLKGRASMLDGYPVNSIDTEMPDHGSSVAGVLAGQKTAGGFRGVAPKADLLCVDWTRDPARQKDVYSTMDFIRAFRDLAEAGATVINFSAGMYVQTYMTYLEEVLGSAFVVFPNDELYDEVWDSYIAYVQNSAKISAKHCLFLLTYLLGQEKDVLFIQAAGNGWKGNTVGKEQAMDAVNTGFFASVTQAVFDEVCRTQEDNQAEDLEEYRMWGKFPYSEFKSRILVVGAVCRETDENGNYRMADFSNYGVSVDICAPGTDLKTASASGGYVTGAQGTSFAAPMVAGAAAFLKSIDEDLTAGEIRELLLKNTDREAFLKNSKTGIKPVLNIGMAVEALLSQEGIMPQPQGNEEHDKLLESKLEGLIAEYGMISTGTREYLAETLNATQLSVPSGELTGVLGGDIYDYDGDGETELMAAVLETRTQGTDGTKTGGTVCRICIYEATEEGAQLADECSISMSGLDSWMDASWQLARGRDLQGRTVLYADAYYSMNDLFFSVVSLCYEDGRLLPKRGVQCAETGAGCACYILSDGAGIEGGNLVGAQGGWTEQVFYPWENAWLESGGPDPEQARSFRMVYEENLKQVGLADANPRGRMMAEEYPEIGAFSGENREEFQRQVQAQEDFYYDCCVRRMDEHFSMADGSALTPLCGVLSPRYRDPDTGRVGIRLTCYDAYRDGR